MSMNIREGNWKPLGNGQTPDLSTAKGCSDVVTLGLPDNVKMVVFQAIDNSVSWRDDGTAATNTSGGSFGGMVLAAGESFTYIGDPSALSFIEAVSTNTAYINVAYYK